MKQPSSSAAAIVDAGPSHKYRTEIPNTVIRGHKSRELSVFAKWLYVYLKSIAGDGSMCFRGRGLIALEAGMSRGQVSVAKKELATNGLIVVTPGKNPRRQADTIRIVDIWPANMQEFSGQEVTTAQAEEPHAMQASCAASGQEVTTDSAQWSGGDHSHLFQWSGGDHSSQEVTTEEDPFKKKKDLRKDSPPIVPPVAQQSSRTKKSAQVRTDYTMGFLQFWNAYPAVRHERKVASFALWQAAGLEPRTDEIIMKIQRLCATLWKGREKHYIPLPTTWLTDARYEDEFVAEENQQTLTMFQRIDDQERQRREIERANRERKTVIH